MKRRLWMTTLLGVGVLGLGLAAVSCGGGTTAAPRGKVLVIGLDGAEWSLIKPMVEAGEMPNLGALMARGVHGNLRSLEPPQKSPAIWTTMATGKSPEEHGIRTFVEKKGGKPLTANLRKVRAVWNIVSGVDRTVGVVGWLMTWPAEAVNGYIVSDYVQYAARDSDRLEARTYPVELEEEVDRYVRNWRDFPWKEVQPFLGKPVDNRTMAQKHIARFRPMLWITAADVSFQDIGLKIYTEKRPDFMAIYLRGMDAMGHLYWNYSYPDRVPASMIDDDLVPWLSNTMRAYYKFTDDLIGPLIDAADEETTILVVSDHGFKGGTEGGVGSHTPDGILVMAGRGVGRGEITGATVYDVLPTTLVLMGLPPAQDMPGKVLWAALGDDIPRDRFTTLIPTYETGAGPDGSSPIESPVDEEILERLRSLGYID